MQASEISQIVQVLKDFRSRGKQDDKIVGDDRIIKIMSAYFVFFLAFVGVLWYSPLLDYAGEAKARLIVQILMIVFYITSAIVFTIQLLYLKKGFVNPVSDFLDLAEHSVHAELKVFKQLNGLSTESIQYLAARFTLGNEQLSRAMNVLVGAIEKVGVLPGLIASFLALSKVSEASGFSTLEYISFAFLGIYFVSFPIIFTAVKFQHFSFILNQYLKIYRNTDSDHTRVI